MTTTSERRVKDLLRESLSAEDLPRSLKVTFRLSGGAPSQQILEEIRMTHTGRSEVRRSDEVRELPLEKGKLKLSPAETRKLFERIAVDLDRLVPRSEAAFPPDTVLGCITVEVENRKADFFYAVEDDEPPVRRGVGKRKARKAVAKRGPDPAGTTRMLRSIVAKELDRPKRRRRKKKK